MENVKIIIENGKTALGIEFGSTRIKAVLVDENNTPIASGAHDWENRHVGHIWTYTLGDIHEGLRDCYAKLKAEVKDKYGITLTTIGAIGISAMMHGYMVFDDKGKMLAPFLTWRNNTAAQAAYRIQSSTRPASHRASTHKKGSIRGTVTNFLSLSTHHFLYRSGR